MILKKKLYIKALLLAVLIGALGGSSSIVYAGDVLTPTKSIPGESLVYNREGIADATKHRASMYWTSFGTGTVTLPEDAASVILTAWGDSCEGAPVVNVYIDGRKIFGQSLEANKPSPYDAKSVFTKGTHSVVVSYLNDFKTAVCDRNAYIDKIDFYTPERVIVAPAPVPAPIPKPAPVTVVPPISKLYVDPNSMPVIQAKQWRTTQPANAALMDKIANQPQAIWLGGYSGDAQSVNVALAGAAAAKARAVFSIYGIPLRDGGQYSAGGLKDAAAYKAWIDGIAAKIGNRPVTLIIEPDAVAMGVPADKVTERWALLTYAVTKLNALPDAKVYLDAGNSAWRKPADMIPRLKAAGIAKADGFSTNVSNFNTTTNEINYGKQISAGVGNKPFVVDTSRNGNGPIPYKTGAPGEYYWCNPSGRALGQRPTTTSGVVGVDAYLWIKRPGESDGTCNGAPKFWHPTYALELARNAKW